MNTSVEQNALELTLDQAFSDLNSNVPAEEIIGRLRALEASCQGGTNTRARLLHLRGLAMNRLGFPGEALGDLHEARQIYETLDDRTGTAQVWRSIVTGTSVPPSQCACRMIIIWSRR